MTSTLASLYTINGESYKKFLQETFKLVSWFALFPVMRAAPQAGRASLATAGDDEAAVEEPNEGEEGCIQGEVPVM